MISNLLLFTLAIAKAALLTGIGPGLAIAIYLELRGVKIVAIGIEKVSAPAVSQTTEKIVTSGNQPAREVLEAAA